MVGGRIEKIRSLGRCLFVINVVLYACCLAFFGLVATKIIQPDALYMLGVFLCAVGLVTTVLFSKIDTSLGNFSRRW